MPWNIPKTVSEFKEAWELAKEGGNLTVALGLCYQGPDLLKKLQLSGIDHDLALADLADIYLEIIGQGVKDTEFGLVERGYQVLVNKLLTHFFDHGRDLVECPQLEKLRERLAKLIEGWLDLLATFDETTHFKVTYEVGKPTAENHYNLLKSVALAAWWKNHKYVDLKNSIWESAHDYYLIADELSYSKEKIARQLMYGREPYDYVGLITTRYIPELIEPLKTKLISNACHVTPHRRLKSILTKLGADTNDLRNWLEENLNTQGDPGFKVLLVCLDPPHDQQEVILLLNLIIQREIHELGLGN